MYRLALLIAATALACGDEPVEPHEFDEGTYVVHLQSGGPAASATDIQVADDPVRGIYAIADSNELFNTSGIVSGGEAVTSQIHVYTVRAYAPDEEVTAGRDGGRKRAGASY